MNVKHLKATPTQIEVRGFCMFPDFALAKDVLVFRRSKIAFPPYKSKSPMIDVVGSLPAVVVRVAVAYQSTSAHADALAGGPPVLFAEFPAFMSA